MRLLPKLSTGRLGIGLRGPTYGYAEMTKQRVGFSSCDLLLDR